MIRDPRHEDLAVVVFHVRDRIDSLGLEFETSGLAGLVRHRYLRVRNTVELQQLQPSVVDLHDRRHDVGSSAALDGEQDLLSRLMDHHVVDDDVVVGGAQERGEFQIESLNEGHLLEIVEVAKLYAGLRRQVRVRQREGVNR